MNRYSIITADPAWGYRDKCNSGKRGASHKYDCLGVEEIKALNVQKISCDNCALFLWATAPMFPEALEVMQAWDFTFKTIAFVWLKKNKKADSFFLGMGNYTRANAEFVLLGLKGKMERKSASVRQIVYSPIQGHSQKPPEVAERIRQLYGPLPGVELFATQRSPLFSTLGNVLDGQDIREVLK